MTTFGSVVWKHVYKPDVPPIAVDEKLRASQFRISFLFDGARLKDDSLVLVGQTGVYNKFAQGPSKLWLLRLDGEGKKLNETFIDDGRTLITDRQLIAATGDGVIVSYTTDLLPRINAIPLNTRPEFGTSWARYDATLKQLSNKTFVTTGMMGAATIVGPAPFVSLIGLSSGVLVVGSDQAGKELWRSQITTPQAFVTPLAAIRANEDNIIAVFNYRSTIGDKGQQVLMIRIKPPRDSSRS